MTQLLVYIEPPPPPPHTHTHTTLPPLGPNGDGATLGNCHEEPLFFTYKTVSTHKELDCSTSGSGEDV